MNTRFNTATKVFSAIAALTVTSVMTIAAGGLLNVSGRINMAAHGNNVGLKLPAKAGVPAAVTGTVEGDIVWDATGDALYVYDGGAFKLMTGGTGISNVVEDVTPQLGGNLDLNGNVITGMVIGTDIQAWDADLGTIAGLAKTDGNFIVGDGSAWTVETGTTARTSLGLGNVENTALSTWAGSSNIVNVGTIASGTWNATEISVAKGGTGATSLTDGGILLGSGTGAVTAMSVLSNGSIVIGDGTTDPTTLSAFTAANGFLKHEYGGLEVSIASIAKGDVIVGLDTGTVGLVTASGHADGDVLTIQADGSLDWEAVSAAAGANVGLSNLSSVAINTSLLSDAADTDDLGSTSKEWANLYIGDTGKAYFGLSQDTSVARSGAGALTLTAANGVTTTGGLTLGGNLDVGTHSLTMSGSLAATGARVTKGWFTDIESTNMITVGGNSLATVFSPIAGSTSIVDVGTIANGVWQGTDVGVAYGGTGASSFTDGGILLGSGTGAITAMAVLADGAIVIGDGTTDPTTLSAFTANNGFLKHEYGGIEADISAVAKGDVLAGSGTGTIALVTASGHSDGEVLTLQADGSAAWEAGAGGGANTALSNLSSVAINASLLPSSADSIDVGSTASEWKNVFVGTGAAYFGTGQLASVLYDAANSALRLTTNNRIDFYSGTDWLFRFDSTGFNLVETEDSYKIGGTSVITTNSLGSGILSSSLTSVGTIATGTWNATDIALDAGGTGASLSDPNADRLLFWDDSETSTTWLTLASPLTLTATTLDVGTASLTADGVVELATSAETTTGTDSTRAITPDGYAGSDYGKRHIEIKVFDDATAATTGDGKVIFRLPDEFAGWNLVGVDAFVTGASSSGALTIDIRNVTQSNADILSTNLTIDESETDSNTAATAAVISTSEDDYTAADQIAIDVDGAGTSAEGLGVILTFQLP